MGELTIRHHWEDQAPLPLSDGRQELEDLGSTCQRKTGRPAQDDPSSQREYEETAAEQGTCTGKAATQPQQHRK